MKKNNIHEIIPDFLYLTKNREVFIFVRPLSEATDDDAAITIEQKDGTEKSFEVIRTVPLLKIVRIIKTALQKKSKAHKNTPFRALKYMEI